MQIAFLGLVTPIMHDFWHQKDGSDAQVLHTLSPLLAALLQHQLHHLVTEIELVDLAAQW